MITSFEEESLLIKEELNLLTRRKESFVLNIVFSYFFPIESYLEEENYSMKQVNGYREQILGLERE